MCGCDKDSGHVCGYCRQSIQDGRMPPGLLVAYYGAWKVAAVRADQ